MPGEVDAERLQELLQRAQEASKALNEYLSKVGVETRDTDLIAQTPKPIVVNQADDPAASRVVEGVFDGVNMLGLDGKQYTIPSNYASKSKLVEGDRLKLTIAMDGRFLYKQIGPVERERIIGVLERDEQGSYFVNVEGRPYRILPASVTFYEAQPGDELVVLIPSGKTARWAAVENIIRV